MPIKKVTIYFKMESENPTRSMKDRGALEVILSAENHNEIKPGTS